MSEKSESEQSGGDLAATPEDSTESAITGARVEALKTLSTARDVIWWGVGCFHFGFREAPPRGSTVGDYLAELTRTLRGISAVDHVEIDVDDDARSGTLVLDGEPPSIAEGQGPYPSLAFTQIDIDLVIPTGVQRELLRSRSPGLFSEHVRVTLRYQYRLPVAFVRVLEPSDAPEASDAVVIVRRLMEREFDRLDDTNIVFQSLGPSPLHADFALIPASHAAGRGAWTLDVAQQRARGYDNYLILYNRDEFADREAAFAAVVHDLGSEADVFYYAESANVRRGDRWYDLQELAERLVGIEEATGLRGWVARQWSAGRMIRETTVALGRYESSTTLDRFSVQEDFANTYRADVQPLIREMVERVRNEVWDYPTQYVRDLVQLFETRRISGAAVTAAIVAAIVGGAVAAVVSLLI